MNLISSSNHTKGSTVVISTVIAVVLLALGIGGFLFLRENKKVDRGGDQDTPNTMNRGQEQEERAVGTEGQEKAAKNTITYTDPHTGVSFRYPATWIFKSSPGFNYQDTAVSGFLLLTPKEFPKEVIVLGSAIRQPTERTPREEWLQVKGMDVMKEARVIEERETKVNGYSAYFVRYSSKDGELGETVYREYYIVSNGVLVKFGFTEKGPLLSGDLNNPVIKSFLQYQSDFETIIHSIQFRAG